MTRTDLHADHRRVMAVTSTRDGHEHLVAEEAITPSSAGHYPALCGHPIWAAVLACPAGPPCPRCAAVRARDTAGRRPDQRPLLRRVLGWVIPARPRRPRQAPPPATRRSDR